MSLLSIRIRWPDCPSAPDKPSPRVPGELQPSPAARRSTELRSFHNRSHNVTEQRTHPEIPTARRRVVAVGITVWQVFEQPPLDDRSTPSLVFLSDVAMRRVRDFPARWWDLSDDALMAVSWRR